MTTSPLRNIDDAVRALNLAKASLECDVTDLRIDAASLRHARQLRTRYFAHDLFADPAWDILLDVRASEQNFRHLSVSSACIGAGVPSTTALSYIKRLIELRLIERDPDQHDQRRSWLRMSEEGREALDRYLLAAARIIPAR